MSLFRPLSPKEEQEFRTWARDNYKPFSSIKTIWHPIVKDECLKINKTKGGDETPSWVEPAIT
tara:strand:- start:917 stop:1105 length:189 start_codon:yes stop_codon:yes gene_type:complete